MGQGCHSGVGHRPQPQGLGSAHRVSCHPLPSYTQFPGDHLVSLSFLGKAPAPDLWSPSTCVAQDPLLSEWELTSAYGSRLTIQSGLAVSAVKDASTLNAHFTGF